MGNRDGVHTTQVGEQGSWVVFCHGLFGQGKNWTQVAKDLSADRRVLLLDLPNHGRSAWTATFDYVDLADRVADELERSTDEPVTLVGHSMGGKIAMLLALRRPDLVERLAVVDVAPVDYQRVGEFAGFVDAMQALDLDALERRSDADEQMADAVPDRGVRAFLLQSLRRADDGTWHWLVNLDLLGEQLGTIGAWPGDRLAGATYDGPVLWIGGADSDYVTEEHVPAMSDLFPRVRRVTVKDAGHWVHAEQQETFVAVLRGFLPGPTAG